MEPANKGHGAAIFLVPLGLLVTLAVLVWHACAYDFVSDDAFIVARYARNVVRGAGWVYNAGERVEGYTSFTWLALTALLGRCGVDYVTAVRRASLAGALLCGVLCNAAAAGVGIRRASPAALLAPLLLSASGVFCCWALGGLEGCGYAALALAAPLAADWALRDARASALFAAGCIGGLAALTRPEGLAIPAAVVALGILPGSQRYRRTLLYGLPVALLLAAHLAWRCSYYGDWLPNTYYAKVGLNRESVLRGAKYVLNFARHNGGLPLLVLPLIIPAIYRATRLSRLLCGVAALLLVGVVLVGGDGLPMYRFMLPIIPLWCVLSAKLIADAAGLTPPASIDPSPVAAAPEPRHDPAAGGAARPVPPGGFRGWRCGLAMVATACIAPAIGNVSRESLFYLLYQDQRNVEIPRWRAAGEWLAANAPKDASAACVPIGAVGYYSDLPIIDMVGLTDRHIARRDVRIGGGWAGHEKTDGAYVLSRKPTYLLLGNVMVSSERVAPDAPNFLQPRSEAIRRRESDLFRPEMYEHYRPRVVELTGGLYFHFMERK
ncbi:MAG: hypothetical protein CHACPFDD_03309 [Phycisphaerae bacterium]|nr:hypothetical protein [Phycisphaerae bacterium]